MKIDLQFFGGRGAGADTGLSDGPTGGQRGDGETKYGQPNTPLVPPAPTIEMQIGKKGKPISADEAIKTINPDRDVEYGDYSENCQRCAVAFELNRRGYNVEASETYKDDPYPKNNNWAKAFKDGNIQAVGATTTQKVSKNLSEKMKAWGNGSRGIIAVSYGGTNIGHAFNVEYSGGGLKYYDAQTGDRYDPKRVFNHVNTKTVRVMRTDNLALSDDVRNMVRKKRSK